MLVLNRRSLHSIRQSYFAYYPSARTDLFLPENASEPRAEEPPEQVVVFSGFSLITAEMKAFRSEEYTFGEVQGCNEHLHTIDV